MFIKNRGQLEGDGADLHFLRSEKNDFKLTIVSAYKLLFGVHYSRKATVMG